MIHSHGRSRHQNSYGLAGLRNHKPNVAHVLAVSVAGFLVRCEVVQGPAIVSHLVGAILSGGGTEPVGVRAVPSGGVAHRSERGPRQSAAAPAIGRVSFVAGEQIERAAASVSENGAKIRVIRSLDEGVALYGSTVGGDDKPHAARVLAVSVTWSAIRCEVIERPPVVGYLGVTVLSDDGAQPTG